MTTQPNDSFGPPTPIEKHKRNKPIKELDGIGPVDKEKIARWLDAQIPGLEREMQQIAYLQSIGQDFPGSAQQFNYKAIGVSWLKYLAWHVRTSRGGPLGGSARKRARQAEEQGKARAE